MTLQALGRLREQEAWYLARDTHVAEIFGRDVDRVLTLLAEHPSAGRPVEGKQSRYCGTRRYRFRVIYRIVADEVVILDVLHPRQSGP